MMLKILPQEFYKGVNTFQRTHYAK